MTSPLTTGASDPGCQAESISILKELDALSKYGVLKTEMPEVITANLKLLLELGRSWAALLPVNHRPLTAQMLPKSMMNWQMIRRPILFRSVPPAAR